MIYTKQPCDYGQVIAPEENVILVYAYHPFNTSDHKVFREWGVQKKRLAKGYHAVVFPSAQGYKAPAIVPIQSRTYRFEERAGFPILFP